MTRKKWRLTKARREIIERAGYAFWPMVDGCIFKGSLREYFNNPRTAVTPIYLYNYETWDDVLELLVTHKMDGK